MRAVVLAALLVGLSVPAFAADVSEPLAVPAWHHPWAQSAGPDFDWAGPFVGINGGVVSGTSSWTAGGLTTGAFALSGEMLGVSAGYNFQTGPWVYGIVGDVDWTNLAGSTANFCFPNCATSSDWLGTIRGRLGFAQGAFMPYVTAGAAFGNISAHFVDNSSGTANSTASGWTAGAGVEIAVKPGWSVMAEALYVDLGTITCSPTVCVGPPTPTTVPLTETLLRLGLNRHF
jgi:outer membrane immunogenic protein